MSFGRCRDKIFRRFIGLLSRFVCARFLEDLCVLDPAATAEYRRLSPPWATGDRLAVSINANPRWFWGGRMRDTSAAEAARLAGDRAISTLWKARITGISCEKSYMTLLLPRLPW